MEKPVISFRYLNHRGESEVRTITFESLDFQFFSSLGYQPGWFISGWCHKKQARRSFALSRILFSDVVAKAQIYSILRL